MTMPNNVRPGGGPAIGTRASDYATSKYYLPPTPPPDLAPPNGNADPHQVDQVDQVGPVDQAAQVAPPPPGFVPRDASGFVPPPFAPPPFVPPPFEPPPFVPADAAGFVPPVVPPPVAPVPARRSRGRAKPVLIGVLVLALLAGAAGGGYWLLHRNDAATPAAAPAAAPAVAPAAGRQAAAATSAAAPTQHTETVSGGYLYRPAGHRFSFRIPHRPVTSTLAIPGGSTLLMVDRDTQALVEWAKFDRTVPAGGQDTLLRGAVSGLQRSATFHSIAVHVITYRGRPARLVTLTSRTGVAFSAIVAVYRPTHLLVILAPTGRTFDLVKNSFRWPL